MIIDCDGGSRMLSTHRLFAESQFPAWAVVARQELVRLGDVCDLCVGGIPEKSPATEPQ